MHTISLGKVRKPEAESIQLHVDRLILAAKGKGELLDLDVLWISRQSGELRDRLIEIGLIAPAADTSRQSFASAIKDYCATMRSWEPSTIAAWNTHYKRAAQFFGPQAFTDITTGRARDFKQHLLGLPLAENTARKTIGCCRQVCAWLIDHERLARNPFAGQPVAIGVAVNQDYVPADRIERIIDACNSHEWELLFVLARFGGMRCPSEPCRAKWSHVNWETSRMIVDSPKTGTRAMPLFPDLKRHLLRISETLPEGSPDYMLPTLREKSGSLHAPAAKIIMRAKEPLWKRIFHNMRSSCQTDLSDKHPISAVCAWMGNSTTIAARHYLQVTEAHFEAAIREAEKCSENVSADKNGQ